MNRPDARLGLPVALALAMHAAALGLVVSVEIGRAESRATSPVASEPPAGIEIDLAAEAPPGAALRGSLPLEEDARDPRATEAPAPSPAKEALAERALAMAAAPASAASAASGPPLEVGSGAPAGSAAGWTFRPNAVVDLRLPPGAANPVGPPAPPGGPDRAAPSPGPASSTGGLVEALDAADVALGLGYGGPVRSAVDAAAHREDAPTFGKATFSVALGADGSVTVALRDASSDRAAWERLRPAIRSALQGAPVRVPLKGRGVRVTVQVEANEQFAGGGRPTPDNKQGVAAQGSIGKVTETKDRVAIELPSVGLTYKTRQCSAGIVANPGGLSLGAGCEPGVAMRVVATKIVGEQRL